MLYRLLCYFARVTSIFVSGGLEKSHSTAFALVVTGLTPVTGCEYRMQTDDLTVKGG